jgi:hypothetical protein
MASSFLSNELLQPRQMKSRLIVPEASWSWSVVGWIDKQDDRRNEKMRGTIAEMLGEPGTIDISHCLG